VSFAHSLRHGGTDSAYAWARLVVSIVISSIGAVGFWSGVVVLPVVQEDFGIARAAASLPYTLTMLGLGLGGVIMGRLSDRFGIMLPIMAGGIALGLGYVAAGLSENLWQFALAHGLLIAVGGAAGFGPMVADLSHWFIRRRGIAVALCACGNYIGGALWPPVVQHLVQEIGWRQTHIAIGIFCALTMIPMALLLRRRFRHVISSPATVAAPTSSSLGFSNKTLQILLAIAGFTCCVAMSMPQVHIVAYCTDLGYGVARGAEMLSLMLAFGVVSRIASGFVADRIGGLGTFMLSSVLQMTALTLYLGFSSLPSLYVISALFGLFQGGLIPSYAIIVREYFPAREAGTRLGIIIMCTLFGMALGGWMSGWIFDITGSYQAAFANGVAWNLLNGAIAFILLWRGGSRLATA